MNFFGLSLVRKSNAPQIWNLVQGHIVIQCFNHNFGIYLVVHCYMLITILTFIFSFPHSMGKFGPKILYFQNWFKYGKWYIVMCWLYLYVILNTCNLMQNLLLSNFFSISTVTFCCLKNMYIHLLFMCLWMNEKKKINAFFAVSFILLCSEVARFFSTLFNKK